MMKLVGTKYGCDRKYFWEQTRNAIEFVIRAIKAEVYETLLAAGVLKAILDAAHMRGYLESCGADSVVNACGNLLGPDLPGSKELAAIFPNWKRGIQLDDAVMLFFADPDNLSLWQKEIPGLHGDDVMENRYMQLHGLVSKALFNITGQWRSGRSYDEIFQAVEAGHSAGILIPGHYVSAGIVDKDTGDLMIKDSWGGRKPEWKGDGFLQPLGRQEFAGVIQTVIYFKPAA
jgi:hypothetical protein